jgi:AraC family transcriptional regulator
VEKHLEASLTLEQLAAVAHLSIYHLAGQFQAATGPPPHHYVIMRRIERARPFQRSGDDHSRAQVAARSGLLEQGHFTRHFQRLVGLSPERFR